MAYRALLTDRERDILSGETEVSQNYLNQIRYRVREKIDRLGPDLELLETYQPDLADYLRETIIDVLNLE